MNRRTLMLGAIAGVTGARLKAQATQGGPSSERVADAERSFAATMAKRDLEAFTGHVAEDAVFIGGTPAAPRVLRGRAAVVEWWRQFFATPEAPFSWEPDLVEVLDSGSLGLTSGPVRDPSGKVTGRFNSIWRRDPDGRWRIVFDKGQPVCS